MEPIPVSDFCNYVYFHEVDLKEIFHVK